MNNQELKNQVKEELAQQRLVAKRRRGELAALPKEQQSAQRLQWRQEKIAAASQRKVELGTMSEQERQQAKRHDKLLRKARRRPVKITALVAVLCAVTLVVVNVVPIVASIGKLTSLKIDSNTPEGVAAREHGKQVAQSISDEGIVLLKNDGNVLPLGGKKLNIFGEAAYKIRYGGGGSGGADQSSAVSLHDGLTNAGIEYNTTLDSFYRARKGVGDKGGSNGFVQMVGAMMGSANLDEPAIDYLTADVLAEARGYSDTALVVLGSDGVEASDFSLSGLGLTQNKRDLLTSVSGEFANVIVIINAGNAIELGFLEEFPAIKAVLWIGTPGPLGCNSLGNILAGAVNPSGRLVDTYAYDAGSNPASVNFGDYKYTNIDKMSFINYNEGIYMGYRFYETYYQGDEAGYKQAVQFPFGYGLSYTSFAWEMQELQLDGDTIGVDVVVTNTGKVAGKDVVQVYFSAPFTPGGIEKSAIELAGYAKTGVLQAGASETVHVSFPVRDMSSYDMAGQRYLLEKGNYQVKLGRNVHDVVATKDYPVATEVTYTTDDATGVPIHNLFDYANGGLTYLSRSDWQGTYPDNTGLSYTAPAQVVTNHLAKPAKDTGAMPTTGADNGLKLKDMKGVAYSDPRWTQFVEQFTTSEMKEIFLSGAYRTVGVERLGVPSTVLLDGPAGINSLFSKVTAASYPTEVVIASTWNDELAYQWGEAVGAEANAYGVAGWYAPAMNLHRTPQGGRNFEYFSEDPLVSGKMSAAVIRGTKDKNVLVFIKHFALNEQETNARSGIFVWANEQAMREMLLRPFEIAVKEGGATGAMSSFSHIGHKWSGGNPELLGDLLRGEWGFTGVVSTDAVLGKFMDLNLAVRYGSDLMLDPMMVTNNKYFDKVYKECPVGITKGLQERMHNIYYALANYTEVV